MNFTVVPFFLAANVVVNDTSKWTFGPEYTYEVNITSVDTLFFMIDQYELIYTLKCRPKMSDSLFCHLSNYKLGSWLNIDVKFEMKFNNRGLEGLVVQRPFLIIEDYLRKIVSQFNNLVPHDLSYLRENSLMGNCEIEYKIRHEEAEMDRLKEGNTDFRLVVLPSTEVKPGTTLWIEKSRMGCINSSLQQCATFSFFLKRLKMKKLFNRIQINNGFKIFTELECNYCFHKKEISRKEIIQISLSSIEPAQDKLPTLLYPERIKLNI